MLKRAFDIVVSAAALLLIWPILLAIGILVRLDSPGPALYRGVRVGRHGKRFRIFKYRTMRTDAELTGGTTTGRDDPRITRIGRILRTYKLDELPQLLNVLKGEMSLVGPRPFVENKYNECAEWHKLRFRCKPGVIGIWQVPADSEMSFNKMIAPDIYYTLSASFWLDVELMLRSLKTLIFGKDVVEAP